MVDQLVEKYNVPGPRYTSYPTVPFWDPQTFTREELENRLSRTFLHSNREISLYIHLPYCESLCTYCGCNTRITKNHGVEERYIDALLKEWEMYLKLFRFPPRIKELHLGGGTPTFFSSGNLKYLITSILEAALIAEDPDFGFEGHPGNTTYNHLKTLKELGFNRVSFGIQDFDPAVQRLINRKQSYEQVKHIVDLSRKIGYQSINFDLIYGLPGQKLETVEDTLAKTALLRPDRIAFYSYAHVPSIKPAQKSYEEYLPKAQLKKDLYKYGRDFLIRSGYHDIGMDHFALESDPMYHAFKTGELHRNFMGYTIQKTDLLVGLGASAIGDAWSAFYQNEKNVEKYLALVNNASLPVLKGHILTDEDLLIRSKILDLICRFETQWTHDEWRILQDVINHEFLNELEKDGLIIKDIDGVTVTDTGKSFVRNVCMAFDAHLQKKKKVLTSFSKTV
ncbi:MAG: oxygen-independent coproporphyrinogen III oxidase [Bacteroidota bacterium]